MFALVDCNSFYASCEKVFRPDLAGRPVVVLSNNDGCVVARSKEAKAMGIGMALPWHEIKRHVCCESVAVFSSNYTLYADFSRRVFGTLSAFAEEIENYSIDESFMKFSPGLNWPTLGAEIQRTVRRNTGIPVSVGFGPTKVLSKVANKVAKTRHDVGGVCVLSTPQEIDVTLASMTPRDVWGIGERLASRLEQVGVKTAIDLKNMDTEVARRILTVVGERIVRELRGASCLPIEEMVSKRTICTARSFGTELSSLDSLREPLASHVSRLAEKLRAQASVCGRMQVFLQTNPFRKSGPQCCPAGETIIPSASNFTPTLVSAALAVLARIWRPGYFWKKIGVICYEIGPANMVQSAFETPPQSVVTRRQRAMAAVDIINGTFGRGTVRIALAGGTSPAWKMRQAALSPCYTTRWEDLPVAAANPPRL